MGLIYDLADAVFIPETPRRDTDFGAQNVKSKPGTTIWT